MKKGRELSKDKVPSGKESVKETNIGTSGNTKGQKSKEGGQIPFLPGAESYEGSVKRDVTSGATTSSSRAKIPFLPDKPE